MIDNPDSYLYGGLAAGGGLAWLAQMAWSKFFSTEGKASDALVQQLSERLAAMELRQAKQESDLDDERKLRRVAEDKVHALELDNVTLRAELSKHGIDLPPSRMAAQI